MYLSRSLSPTLREALGAFPAVLLTGPRQSGNTTFLRHDHGDRFAYVAFDDPRERDFARADPLGFPESLPRPTGDPGRDPICPRALALSQDAHRLGPVPDRPLDTDRLPAARADARLKRVAKAFAARGRKPDLYYWRTHDGLEVDLLIQVASRRYPVEIKLTATPTARHVEPLNRPKALMGDEAAEEGMLVCAAADERALPGGNRVLPWQRFPGWVAGLLA
jgi:predicted AAA+ superfamily ATPase